MREIALVTLLLLSACKSSEKSSSAPSPTPSAAPAPAESEVPEATAVPPEQPAADEPGNTLKVGATVRKEWTEGGPGEVVWKVEGGTVTLKPQAGEPEGRLLAVYQGKQQHVTNFSCDTVRAGSEAAFALTAEGKVLFRAAVGPAGKRPGDANVFLLEWKPDQGSVSVANSWRGTSVAEPPPWAKM